MSLGAVRLFTYDGIYRAVFKAGYDIDIVMEGRGKESVGWMKMGQSLSWTGIVGSLRWVR